MARYVDVEDIDKKALEIVNTRGSEIGTYLLGFYTGILHLWGEIDHLPTVDIEKGR